MTVKDSPATQAWLTLVAANHEEQVSRRRGERTSSRNDAAARRAADALEDERLAAIQCVAAIRGFSDRT